jgi:ATP-binding cassette subfamily G (WHITE) protein 2 (PDR)
MASTGVFGALPQSEVAAEKAEEKVEQLVDENKGGDRQTSATPSSDSQSMGEKEIVHNLARAFTHNSVKNDAGEYINPFETDNPVLDPSSDRFSARAWTKNLVGIQSRDPERYPGRTAGIAYKNISAHGFVSGWVEADPFWGVLGEVALGRSYYGMSEDKEHSQ